MRLIDADKLKECYAGNDTNKADYLSIRKMIDSCKTYYDVEKVVEQLEQQKQQYNSRAGQYENRGMENEYRRMFSKACSYEHAIKIVKQGGVGTDDACEWKQEDDNLITSCGDYFNILDNCTEKFDFCPKCGKKIKVVER